MIILARRLCVVLIWYVLFACVVLGLATVSGAARAADITYPQLNTQTTVQDTDLIATWRASGPLAKVQASVLNAYIQGKLSSTFAQTANNLSDLANEATARTNLGLGTAATQNTGTSGMALCLMNNNCVWTGTETFNAKVTTGVPSSAGAMFNLPQGAAPTSPIAGDVWATSSGLFVNIGGATYQVLTDYLPWQNYTPATAPTPDSGSFGSVSYTNAKFMRINKTIWFELQVNIASVGSASGCIVVGTPVQSANGNNTIASEFDNNASLTGSGIISGNSTAIRVCGATGFAPWSGADTLNISGFYQAAS